MKLSVVISAYNEEERIKKCLESVSFADEIIVIDNSSTDNTAKVAASYTKNVFRQENNPKAIDLLKNLGFDKAQMEWVLSLDADEEVDRDLEREILDVIKKDKKEIDGYFIPRKNIIFGKWMRHTGWYPDYQLRLFRRGKGKFLMEHVHEQIKLDGKTGHLKNHILHDNYQNISQFLLRTITIYAPNEAEHIHKKGYEFSYSDAIRMPLNEFLSRFFARQGYKDGFHGLMLSLLMAFYHLVIFSYLWEKNSYKDDESYNAIKHSEGEFQHAKEDIMYWIDKEKIEITRNPAKKGLFKVIRKLQRV